VGRGQGFHQGGVGHDRRRRAEQVHLEAVEGAAPGAHLIDYLRNGRGATSISAYSTRARPGAPVSTPLFWEELDTDVRANTYTVQNLPARLESLESDPWEGFFDVRQTITAAMKKAVGME
jgi:bifunctional non-homologous end joining protein LigD